MVCARGFKRLSHRRVPTVILANVQSFRNKVDEVQANVKFLTEYKCACLLTFMETWQKEQDQLSDLEIDGFGIPFRVDIDPMVTGESVKVCLYVNKSWCNMVVVRETLCTPDIELISVSLRPFYLPREFPQIFVSAVYIHPRADMAMATWAMANMVNQLQGISSDGKVLVHILSICYASVTTYMS